MNKTNDHKRPEHNDRFALASESRSPGQDGVPTVAIEVEDRKTGLLLVHEFTHAVEAEQAGLSLDWKRSLAHTIFAEGLAMRVVQALHPGGKAEEYVGEFSPHWFERSLLKRQAILTDLAPHLEADNPDTVMLYTMGKGGVGIEREAYFAGWFSSETCSSTAGRDEREPTIKIVCPQKYDYSRKRFGVFSDGCPNLIWELMRTRREKLSISQLMRRNPSEAIVDRDNHLRDCAKYVVLSLPRPAEIPPSMTQAKIIEDAFKNGTYASLGVQVARFEQQNRRKDEAVSYRGRLPSNADGGTF